MIAPSHMDAAVEALRRAARPATTHDDLVAMLARCRTVLLGESTHGTDEFYRERAAITKRLIVEHGFSAVAIEGDWPDTHRVHRYVTGRGEDLSGREALAGFRRFPAWLWRNTAMLEFVEWLADHNAALPLHQQCGIHGLDLYSLHASAECVLRYLEQAAPDAVPRARERYGCLEGTSPDPHRYAHEVMLGIRPSCERELLEQLVDLSRRRAQLVSTGTPSLLEADEAWFDAQQNAFVARNAERYYRTMFLGSSSSWNLRDSHMAETLLRLQQRASRRRAGARVVVWAHNSHVGDSTATELGRRGQVTLGGLLRREQGDECALVGFTTSGGSVTAAREWDGPAGRHDVRPALDGSVEHLFHRTGLERFTLLRHDLDAQPALRTMLLQRAIGVVYRPQAERESHWYRAMLSRQYDAVVHIDSTRGVQPLERLAPAPVDELAETWPTGM